MPQKGYTTPYTGYHTFFKLVALLKHLEILVKIIAIKMKITLNEGVVCCEPFSR